MSNNLVECSHVNEDKCSSKLIVVTDNAILSTDESLANLNEITQLPVKRSCFSFVVSKNRVFIVGGQSEIVSEADRPGGEDCSQDKTLLRYDLSSQSWNFELTNLPGFNLEPVCLVIDDEFIYTFRGLLYDQSKKHSFAHRYDINLDKWIQLETCSSVEDGTVALTALIHNTNVLVLCLNYDLEYFEILTFDSTLSNLLKSNRIKIGAFFDGDTQSGGPVGMMVFENNIHISLPLLERFPLEREQLIKTDDGFICLSCRPYFEFSGSQFFQLDKDWYYIAILDDGTDPQKHFSSSLMKYNQKLWSWHKLSVGHLPSPIRQAYYTSLH